MRLGIAVVCLVASVIAYGDVLESPSRVESETSQYDAHFRKYSKRYFGPGFNWRWFKAQAFAESRLKPDARSAAGAVGIMQILPSTFQEIKAANPQFNRIDDPKWNIAAGIYYDRQLYRKLDAPWPGDERLFMTFAGYNAGYGGVLRALKRTGKEVPGWKEVKPHLPLETRKYVGTITRLMADQGRARGLQKYL